jgi:hypothetical protein
MAPARRLSIVKQALGLRSVFPDTPKPAVGRDWLSWTGRLQPCELSRVYTVQITYTLGRYPITRILDPQLAATETGFLPHTYDDRSLCLHDAGQWADHMLIVDTIVPWAAEWLLHYEMWLATGEWLGDDNSDTPLPAHYDNLPEP